MGIGVLLGRLNVGCIACRNRRQALYLDDGQCKASRVPILSSLRSGLSSHPEDFTEGRRQSGAFIADYNLFRG